MRLKIGEKLPSSELFYLDANNDVKKIDVMVNIIEKITKEIKTSINVNPFKLVDNAISLVNIIFLIF